MREPAHKEHEQEERCSHLGSQVEGVLVQAKHVTSLVVFMFLQHEDLRRRIQQLQLHSSPQPDRTSAHKDHIWLELIRACVCAVFVRKRARCWHGVSAPELRLRERSTVSACSAANTSSAAIFSSSCAESYSRQNTRAHGIETSLFSPSVCSFSQSLMFAKDPKAPRQPYPRCGRMRGDPKPAGFTGFSEALK